jgi:NADPH-dependent 2,4-dienoyl-CoA reductase/sulfur reductase-like enzyme/nitrite reductase/ring-hydroxylating ferredoxin subunit
MGGEQKKLTGPDFTQGIPFTELPDGGMVLGHAQGEAVVLARRAESVFAVSARCTHYGGPLVDGLFVGETVRCPWHHACFDLRTGEAVRAPALNNLVRWNVERRADKVYVTGKAAPLAPRRLSGKQPEKIVIVGAGAAGNAAAEMLRREGFAGSITMIGADPSIPYDRPNLSKDYLAGTAPEEWIPLRSPDFYAEKGIKLVLGTRAKTLDTKGKRVTLENNDAYPFDRLLLATGADPIRLTTLGSDLPHVFTLRSLADSRSIVAKALKARAAVVIGSSFIGLEVAASLRARNVDVHVVAPEAVPLERVMGPEIGDFVRRLHEQHGVAFHLRHTARSIDPSAVILDDGTRLPADLVVMGVGVRPSTALAEQAGLTVENGVVVDEYLQTNVPGIFAAGDIARWPDPHTGERLRIEHWVVAERQGQTAARNMLGFRERFDSVPFFWSAHYELTISYVGHASRWDRIEIAGSLGDRDCRAEFIRDGKRLAVATIGRDRESLEAERAMEQLAAHG